MKVFMIGAIYINGCHDKETRAYAPDGHEFEPAHFASLWVEDEVLNRHATTWWPYYAFWHSDLGVTEFRIPKEAQLIFPDGNGGANCCSLERSLAKLHKEKEGKEFEFDVDPHKAETIAEFRIDGGRVEGLQLDGMGVAEWTIDQPTGSAILVVLKDDVKNPKRIVLNEDTEDEPEIVFSNTHHSLTDRAEKHAHYRGHEAVFKKLSPDDKTIVAHPPHAPGNMQTNNPVLDFMTTICNCANEPCCCKNGGIHGHNHGHEHHHEHEHDDRGNHEHERP